MTDPRRAATHDTTTAGSAARAVRTEDAFDVEAMAAWLAGTAALCEDATVIGTPFYVMQRIDGLIVGKSSTKPLPHKHLR